MSNTDPSNAGPIAKEPVITIAGVTAVLGGVGAFAVTHGWIGATTDNTLIQTLAPVVTVVVVAVAGFLARRKVTPVAKVAPVVVTTSPPTA